MAPALGYHLEHRSIRQAFGSEAVVDDVDDAVEGGVVGVDDVDPVDRPTVRSLREVDLLSLHCGLGQPIHQVLRQHDAGHGVVVKDLLHVRHAKQVQLIEVHEVAQCLHPRFADQEDGMGVVPVHDLEAIAVHR